MDRQRLRTATGAAARETLNVAWRALARYRAVDQTELLACASALVVAPHPDDETLGCGALIARKAANGAAVHVVVATDGSKAALPDGIVTPEALARVRSSELHQATATLGLEAGAVTELGFSDQDLAANRGELEAALLRIVQELRPEEIYIPCVEDGHPDHQAANGAVRALLAHAGLAARVYEYLVSALWNGPWQESLVRHGAVEVPRRLAGLLRESGRPCKVRCEEHLTTKRAALAAYRSQLEQPTSWGRPLIDERLVALSLAPEELFLVRARPA